MKTSKTAIVIFLLLIIGMFTVIYFFNTKESKSGFNQSSVVVKIQSLNRLETASFTIEKIIESGTGKNAFENVLFGDKILLIAHANIIAGFDFSKIKETDIKVNGGTLTIQMPAPEILVSKLDNEKTRVYDRKLGFLTKGNPSLEAQTRLIAENSIKQDACKAGILDSATINAKKQIIILFTSVGFKEVILKIPSGNCE
ncbi:DUF4230 domain-containing protein [Arenimonas sp.]|nr:DUF4230 domain-containing protein [Candidatus Parcubacteria bacterium]